MRKLAILLALVAACGDDDTPAADAPTGADAPPTVDGGPTPDAPIAPTTCTCLALGVDYVNGVGIAKEIRLPDLTVTPSGADDLLPGAVSGDPVVRYRNGTVFVVNRFGADNVTIVDPVGWVVVDQFSTGAGSNPQDIAVRGNKGYVVALGVPEVQVWDLADTQTPPVAIPLPTKPEDTDGNPDAASIAIVGNRAYVVLQHLEMFSAAAPGTIVVIDTTSDTVETSFDLANVNPSGFLQEAAAGRLLVSEVTDFTPSGGCVERIETGGSPMAGGCLVQHAALGGYVTAIAPSTDGHVYLAASQSFSEGKLVRVADDGTPDPMAYSAAGQLVTDVAACPATGQLLTNDGNTGVLRVYDADTHTEVTGPQGLSLGLGPAFTGGIVCF